MTNDNNTTSTSHRLTKFKSGKFHLRKWVCNWPDAISYLPDSLKTQKPSHSFNPDSSQRIFGLKRTLEANTFCIQINEESVKTKRQLLSIKARIFDPLGLLR